MIAQLLEEKGRQKGIQEGRQEGRQEGNTLLLSRQLSKKYHHSADEVNALLEGLYAEDLLELGEYMLDCESYDQLVQWIVECKQHKAGQAGLN